MLIKIHGIIFFFAMFLGICADISLQQHGYEERLTKVETVVLKKTKEIEDLKMVVLTQKKEILQLKMTLSKVTQIQRIHDNSFSVLRRLIMKSKSNLESAHADNTLREDNENKKFKPLPEIKKGEVSLDRASKLVDRQTSQQNTKTVAFYALLSHNELNPGPHHILAFDLVKTNIHNSYNHFTGAFTAPINGVYGFIYTLRMLCNTYGTFEIVKNDEVEGAIHVNVENGCAGQFSTGSIVVVLNVGDTVYVRTHSTSAPIGSILSDINGRPYFAGWLIASL